MDKFIIGIPQILLRDYVNGEHRWRQSRDGTD